MNIENIKKPENFEDLLELQKILDEEVGKPRGNGFIPRVRVFDDIILSLDDEFNEWLKELPYELNFKTWKQKTYSREKELEEITDCLFFYLQAINRSDYLLKEFKCEFDSFRKNIEIKEVETLIFPFKEHLFSDFETSFYLWLDICKSRGFTKQEMLDMYFKKWQKNITRIKGDWTK